jgi:pre-mRNA-splicing factor SYF1
VEPKFWSEWNNFEIEHGSEDTFRCVNTGSFTALCTQTFNKIREYLRIRRSVQALFNTEASYLAAQTITARQGNGEGQVQNSATTGPALDAMAATEKATTFVRGQAESHLKGNGETKSKEDLGNQDEIQISDDEE